MQIWLPGAAYVLRLFLFFLLLSVSSLSSLSKSESRVEAWLPSPGIPPANYHQLLAEGCRHPQSHSSHRQHDPDELLPIPVPGGSLLLLLLCLCSSTASLKRSWLFSITCWAGGKDRNPPTDCVHNVFLAAHLTRRLWTWLIELLRRIMMLLIR